MNNPRRYESWYINRLTRDRYGTDVPTLQADLERLERRLRQRSDTMMRQQRDYNDLRRSYSHLRRSYNRVFGAYERAVGMLRERGGRRNWRLD